MKYCFVFICQKGELEIKSMLLAASLKENLHCNYELVAAIPYPESKWGTISKETERVIRKLKIKKIRIENQIDTDYPIGNKLSCLGIETNADKIVFLDSDILCLRNFSPGDYLKNKFNAKPADLKTFQDWEPVYELFNMDLPQEKVLSTSSREEMLPYFNAGMIAVDNEDIFAKEWISCCKDIDRCEKIPNKRPWLDQIGLPITIKKLDWDYGILDERFNYPAHLKKMPTELPFLCHYHFPEVVDDETRLFTFIDNLIKKYPLIKEILKISSNWGNILKRIENLEGERSTNKSHININNYFLRLRNRIPNFQSSDKSNSSKKKNLIITGIPRSGTSYLCKLLFSIENVIIINEPEEVFPLLDNISLDDRSINKFYDDLRYKIISGEEISNKISDGEIIEDTAKNDSRVLYKHSFSNKDFLLGVKNTLAYLSALPNLMRTMPDATIVACIRNPIDTIASWKNSFSHLRNVEFENFPKTFFNYNFRSHWQNDAIYEIVNTDDIVLKRALLWNYLSEMIYRNMESINLIKYEELVKDPNREINKITYKFPEYQFDFNASQLRTSRESINSKELEKIRVVCSKQALRFGYII